MVTVRASLLIPGTGRKPSMCVCVLVSGGLRHGEVGGPPGAPNPSIWPLSWLQLSRPKQMGICAVSQNPQQIFVRSHRSTALEPGSPKTQAQEALLTHRSSSCFTMTPPPLARLLAGWVRPCAQSPDAQGESLGEHVLPFTSEEFLCMLFQEGGRERGKVSVCVGGLRVSVSTCVSRDAGPESRVGYLDCMHVRVPLCKAWTGAAKGPLPDSGRENGHRGGGPCIRAPDKQGGAGRCFINGFPREG